MLTRLLLFGVLFTTPLCGTVDAAAHEPAHLGDYKWIAQLKNEDFRIGPGYWKVINAGVPALPQLIERLKHAPKDDSNPLAEEPKLRPSTRFFVQLCIKHIIRKDYLANNPQTKGVGWTEADHSEDIISWWAKSGAQVVSGKPYKLPSCLNAVPR